MMSPQSDLIARSRPRRGSIVVEARAFLTTQDWARLAEPGTEPYLQVALMLRPVAAGRAAPYRQLRAVVYADRPLALVARAEAQTELGNNAFPIYNLPDLKPFLLRAWRRLAGN
jgi:hypothetical protein